MPLPSLITDIICVLVPLASLYLVKLLLKKQTDAFLPPGPPADPVIGHLRRLPDINVRAERFYDWSREYGDVFSLRVPGKTMIVLNSEKAASELLEKRSSTSCNRPSFPIIDRIGWQDALLFMPYGARFAEQRKFFQQSLGKGSLNAYHRVQEREVNILLKDLYDQPQEYDTLVHKFTMGLVFIMTFGHQIQSPEDKFFQMHKHLALISSIALRPSLLEIFPSLDKLPAWFPGAWWIKFIETRKPMFEDAINTPFDQVQEEMSSGKARPSFVSRHLEKLSETAPDDIGAHYMLKMAAHMVVIGASGTTWHTITTFMACILLNPEVQAKGQAEIDKVVGRDRLPDFADRDALPYVECVLLESMRWHPVVPSGAAHTTTTDQFYEGMYIPKGALILANTRSMTWDEKFYHEPRAFKPERFLPKPLGAGEALSPNVVFGWGRRICPGRFFADATLWLAIARFLAVFNISKAKSTDGRPIEPDIKFASSSGLTSHPTPFPCNISPRDDNAARLIHDSHIMSEST